MLELEQQALALLTDTRRRRFTWLAQNRLCLAQTIAEMCCWGVWDLPALERQLQLTEQAMLSLVPDLDLATGLSIDWAVRDASLIHSRHEPPAGFDCSVCIHGRYGIDAILARVPAPIE